MADLPPTQYLIMGVLAARHRLGEHLWTFPSNLAVPMRALEEQGLISVMHGITSGSIRARLTEAGIKHSLKPDYVTPIQDVYDTAFDQIDGHLEQYRGAQELREGVRAAVADARSRLAQLWP